MTLTKKYFEEKCQIIHAVLDGFTRDGKSIFSTSSFQTQSLPLLHALSLYPVKIPIYVTNTGFLFPDTHKFIRSLAVKFQLDVRYVYPTQTMEQQKDRNGVFHYVSDSNYCCQINKIEPIRKVVTEYDIWISGIRRDQSSERLALSDFESIDGNCLRYHPMLDWSAKDVFYYSKEYGLPNHPLDESGFQSIGCQPCTVLGAGLSYDRNGRWRGQKKTECGLVTDLIAKG